MVGMASREDEGCFKFFNNCMLVVFVEDGADVVQGVDGVVYCHHTFICVFPDISGRYEICPL